MLIRFLESLSFEPKTSLSISLESRLSRKDSFLLVRRKATIRVLSSVASKINSTEVILTVSVLNTRETTNYLFHNLYWTQLILALAEKAPT